MKPFLVVCGSLFALVVIVHIVRLHVEPHSATNPWLWIVTVSSAVLCVWAWRLAWTSRRAG